MTIAGVDFPDDIKLIELHKKYVSIFKHPITLRGEDLSVEGEGDDGNEDGEGNDGNDDGNEDVDPNDKDVDSDKPYALTVVDPSQRKEDDSVPEELMF